MPASNILDLMPLLIMKVLKGIKLLFSNPLSFVERLRQIIVVARTRRRLEALGRKSDGMVWVAYGDVEFPYHTNTADEQELLYHAFFQEWFKATEVQFAEHVKPGDTVIDVGANMGFITLVLSRLVGSSGKVLSFEPGGSMFTKLKELVGRNNLAQVELHHMGCGDKSDKLTLSIPASSGNASLRLSPHISDEVRCTESVVIEPLDAVIGDRLSQLHFLKIDTEGFEIDVLRGAERTIDRLLPIIYIELSKEYLDSSAASIAWLTAHGYTFPVHPDLEQCRNGDNFFVIPPVMGRALT